MHGGIFSPLSTPPGPLETKIKAGQPLSSKDKNYLSTPPGPLETGERSAFSKGVGKIFQLHQVHQKQRDGEGNTFSKSLFQLHQVHQKHLQDPLTIGIWSADFQLHQVHQKRQSLEFQPKLFIVFQLHQVHQKLGKALVEKLNKGDLSTPPGPLETHPYLRQAPPQIYALSTPPGPLETL